MFENALAERGPALARDLAALQLPDTGEDGLIDALAWAEKLARWATAAQLALISELARRRGRPEFVEDEIAAELRLSRVAAGTRVGLALDLERLPSVGDALAAGQLDLPKAKAIADAVAPLDPPRVEQVTGDAVQRAGEQTVGELRAWLRRTVLSADPAAAELRHREARADRRVTLTPVGDGMAELWALLPADEATRAYAVIDACAREARGSRAIASDGVATANEFRPAVGSFVPGPAAVLPLARGPRRVTDSMTVVDSSPARADQVGSTVAGSGRIAHPLTTARESGVTSHSDLPAGGHVGASGRASGRPPDVDGGSAVNHQWMADRAHALSSDVSAWRVNASDRRRDADDVLSIRAGVPRTRDDGDQAGRVETTSPDTRTADQRRADALVDLLIGRARAQVTKVHVTVPLATVVGAAEHPGELAGLGPVPASMARRLAADGVWRWLRLSEEGTVAATGRHGYRPPAALADLIRARDRTCRFPGCRQPAHRCDLDHTVAYPVGPTASTNLAALCRHHHRLKHEGGWTVRQDADARLTWISPAGRTYTTSPPRHPARGCPPPRASRDNNGER